MTKIFKLILLASLVTSAGCSKTVAQWSQEKPSQDIAYKMPLRQLAVCVKEILTFSQGSEFTLSRSPENGSLFVSAGDGINPGAISVAEFADQGNGITRLKTRGMFTFSGDPLMTNDMVQAADKCAPRLK